MITNNPTATKNKQMPDDGDSIDFSSSPQQLLKKTARALCSCRFVVITLTVVIILELLTIIVGATVRLSSYVPKRHYERLEQKHLHTELSLNSTRQALLSTEDELKYTNEELQVAKSELSETLFALEQTEQLISGSAALAGNAGSTTGGYTENTQPLITSDETEEFDHNAPPPLRQADIETLVFEETGTILNIEKQPEQTSSATETENVVPASRNLSKEDSQELELLIRQGISALVEGDMRRCIQSFESAYSISPEHPALLYYYGMAFDKLRNPDKARKYYTEIFRMRSTAGKYYDMAKRRLEHSFEQPSDARGKIAFGPHTHLHTEDNEGNQTVSMRLPILLAPDTHIAPEDLLIQIQFYVLVNNRKIQYAPGSPIVVWENEEQDWSDNEENILITYKLPHFNREEEEAYGDISYYGFTAKCYYKEEPVDCLSTPSALILHEQRIKAREAKQKTQLPPSLLPDDGLAPQDLYVPDTIPTDTEDAESATPFSEFIKPFEVE